MLVAIASSTPAGSRAADRGVDHGRDRQVNHIECAGGTHDMDMIPYAFQTTSKLLRWHAASAFHWRKEITSAV